mgnify:CR=1 FL=1
MARLQAEPPDNDMGGAGGLTMDAEMAGLSWSQNLIMLYCCWILASDQPKGGADAPLIMQLKNLTYQGPGSVPLPDSNAHLPLPQRTRYVCCLSINPACLTSLRPVLFFLLVLEPQSFFWHMWLLNYKKISPSSPCVPYSHMTKSQTTDGQKRCMQFPDHIFY